MKVAVAILVMGTVVVAVTMARPEGEQDEKQFHTLLETNDVVTYDRDDPESFVARRTRQNIRWTGIERGPSVLVGNNFKNRSSCLQRCKQMNYERVIFRNGVCRCLPELMRVGVVE